MRLRRLILGALLVGLVAGGLAWAAGSIAAWPHNHAVPAPSPPAHIVQFTASDGTRLAGSYWPAQRGDAPAILLLHGISESRLMFAEHARWLNGLGYAVLAMDFRGHGGSAAVERTFGLYEARDAEAAVAFLRADDPTRRIGVVGVSLGGAAALLGEDGPLPVEAMVLQAVYPDLRTAIANRIDQVGGGPLTLLGEPLLSYQAYPRYGVPPGRIAPIDGLRRFRGAVLVIGGTADRSTTPADTLALHRVARGRKALWMVDDADHVETSRLWSEAYRRRVRCFFDRSLGEPGTSGEAPCATSPSS